MPDLVAKSPSIPSSSERDGSSTPPKLDSNVVAAVENNGSSSEFNMNHTWKNGIDQMQMRKLEVVPVYVLIS